MRWGVMGEKATYLEDAIAETIAGIANSPYGGTLLVGVSDDGAIHGLEDDYATFSKRGERGDHDLWGQQLKNLLDRPGKYAATLVDWDFFHLDGRDIDRGLRQAIRPPGLRRQRRPSGLLVALSGEHRRRTR